MERGREFVSYLLSLLLLFGAVAGASETCFDDTSIYDDVIEAEAILVPDAKPRISLRQTPSLQSNAHRTKTSVSLRISDVGGHRKPAAQAIPAIPLRI